jgi:outer membrane protein assembly factor BamB
VESSPAVANGVVYVGGKKVYALDAATGALLWSHGDGYNYGDSAVANGVLYIGSGDGGVYAFGLTNVQE